jgi:alpha-D-ribose 1-methylphosphonate 5-triphosphate diphosphatase
MSSRQNILFSRSVVTPNSVIPAHVVIENGMIVAIDSARSASHHAEDLGDDVLIPGLIDVHTDNLEKHYQPRPGALWDAMGAALAHDAQCATAGITTVFDSLSLHGRKDGLDRKEALGPMIAGMDAAAAEGFLRAEHLLHLRCEITNPDLMALVEPQLSNPRLRLLSVMDHTPGQRQTANVQHFRERMIASGKTGAELDEALAARTEWRDQAAGPANRRAIVAIARAAGIPLMSHDDMTAAHVEESRDDGCVASEFPVTMEASELARQFGMKTIMGAPNFVRGGSHSGNLSARDCAAAGLLDALASDYVPLSMVRAAFQLSEPPFSWPLQDAIAIVAANPARLCGLQDRGEIAVGQRGDLVRIALSTERWPTVRTVWREGVRVA